MHPLIPLAVLKQQPEIFIGLSPSPIVHPLIPLAVLKPNSKMNEMISDIWYCAPTYTACGIETSLRSKQQTYWQHCAPTYTACGIESKQKALIHH